MPIPSGLLERIENLDPLPITAQRLIEAMSTGQVNVLTIKGIIEFDQAIASNVLKLANSALYGGLGGIHGVRDAVMRLGTSTVMNVALDEGLRVLRADAPMYELTEDDLWLHGAAASLAVEELARESRGDKIPEFASIAALIHDVGKLVIVRYMKNEVDAFIAHTRCERITFVDAERKVLGCEHGEIGGAMARKWNFPPPIIRAIEEHHIVPIREPDPTLDTVMLANLVAKTVGTGLGAEGMNFEIDLQAPRRLGIDNFAFDRVALRTSLRLSSLKRAYGIADGQSGAVA
jgi:putative nucleotidyltransferase with HDIG domain